VIHILSIDTETSGLARSGIEKGSEEYPFLLEVGLELFAEDGTTAGLFKSRVRSDGRSIQPGATAVHGISDRAAVRDGVSEIAALAVISGFAAQADYLIGYSVSYDRDIIESALIRRGKETRMLVRPGLEVIDIKLAATAACKIPTDHSSGSYKWPSMDVAAEMILGEPPRVGPHDALLDCQKAKRLFMALKHLTTFQSTLEDAPSIVPAVPTSSMVRAAA
jgi:DNA polymerase III epsilon subunit-like protein